MGLAWKVVQLLSKPIVTRIKNRLCETNAKMILENLRHGPLCSRQSNVNSVEILRRELAAANLKPKDIGVKDGELEQYACAMPHRAASARKDV